MFDVTTTAIMPKHIYDGTDYRNNPANQKPIGTGAFQFVEWQRGNFIRLKRFDDYWKPGQPYLDEIIYRIVPDSQSRALALQTGQVLMSGAGDIEPFDVPRFQQQANLAIETKGWGIFLAVMWIELNHRVKPLDDVRVRQAMSMAVDRDFILKRLWFGIGKAATSPVASTTRFYDPASKLAPHDIKQANALLDEAGLKPDADGVRFKLRHLVLPYGEIWSRLSEYLRASFKQIGDRADVGKHRHRRLGAANRGLGTTTRRSTLSTSTATRRWGWSGPMCPPTSRRSSSPTPAATRTPRWTRCSPPPATPPPRRNARSRSMPCRRC